MPTLNTRSPGQPYLVERNPGYFEYQLPVSLKAVISWKGWLPLLRNERDEWELPGGKLDLGEEPAECLAREIQEELAWDATVGEPFHSWVYRVFPDRHVFVLTFLATYDGDAAPAYSHEHKELVLVTPDEAVALDLPQGYRTAIRRAVELGHLAPTGTRAPFSGPAGGRAPVRPCSPPEPPRTSSPHGPRSED